MFVADGWKDYQVIDAGSGEKLERWGDIVLRRPDPQAVWPKDEGVPWQSADAYYNRASSGGGFWEFKRKLPERWQLSYGALKFHVRPTGFKHTGLFPEQAVNWDFMTRQIREAGRQISMLNLFAYTGGATVACASAGAAVCHVDAAKGMVNWARENAALSGLSEAPIRYIVDDCEKFVQREIRRGRKYDAIVMDPPSYGRGPGGEVWHLEDKIASLVELCVQVLSDEPLFFVLNGYTTGLQPTVLRNLLTWGMGDRGRVEAGEVCLPMQRQSMLLPCGATARWTAV
jgi:23S rRNA (cytosine1962-C5)-methyltransferase